KLALERQGSRSGAAGSEGSKIQNPKSFVPGDENWDDGFYLPAVNGDVYAIAISGSDVYLGGSFTIAGRVFVNHIARWDGSQWSALGSGVTGGNVSAMAISGNDVYVGGYFTTA